MDVTAAKLACFLSGSCLLFRGLRMENATGAYHVEVDNDASRSALDLGPPLPSEAAKAPWRPKVAGIIAFFFGPMAGALVVVSSLRRMGHQDRAKRVMLLALAGA